MTEILEAVNPEFINWVRSNAKNLIIVLTGGGSVLPMAKNLAAKAIMVSGSSVNVAPALAFPLWLREDYAGLEDHYSSIAVSLGGARKNVIQSRGVARTTGGGRDGHVLESFPTKGI